MNSVVKGRKKNTKMRGIDQEESKRKGKEEEIIPKGREQKRKDTLVKGKKK